MNYFNKPHNINYSGSDLLNILLIIHRVNRSKSGAEDEDENNIKSDKNNSTTTPTIICARKTSRTANFNTSDESANDSLACAKVLFASFIVLVLWYGTLILVLNLISGRPLFSHVFFHAQEREMNGDLIREIVSEQQIFNGVRDGAADNNVKNNSYTTFAESSSFDQRIVEVGANGGTNSHISSTRSGLNLSLQADSQTSDGTTTADSSSTTADSSATTASSTTASSTTADSNGDTSQADYEKQLTDMQDSYKTCNDFSYLKKDY